MRKAPQWNENLEEIQNQLIIYCKEADWTSFSTKEKYSKVPASTEIRNTLVSDLYQLFSCFAFIMCQICVCVKFFMSTVFLVQIEVVFRFQM